MSDWAERIAAKLKSDEEAKKSADERFLEERRLTKALAPREWQTVRECLKLRCGELNDTMGKQVVRCELCFSDKVIVRMIDKPRTMPIEFDHDTRRLRYEGVVGSKEFVFRMKADIGRFETLDGIPHKPEQIAEEALLEVLDARF